jgi:protease YdgD
MSVAAIRLGHLPVLALLAMSIIGIQAAKAETPTGFAQSKSDVSVYPWSSIAKLNNSVGGSCTAVAIERDRVLTAAHCIFNRRTGRFLPPSSLHVLFGYERGDYLVHSLVSAYQIGSGYDPAKEAATISSDWAVLRLTEPLPVEFQPLQLVDRIPAVGSPLMIGSYARETLHVMTVDRGCELLGEERGSALLEHNCKASRGSSGAPLLMMENGTASILGIQVAIGQRDGSKVMVAISASGIREGILSH